MGGLQLQSARMRRGRGRRRLQLEMALNELAEFFAVFIAHVHEFDAAAVRADIADDGGKINFTQAGTNFEFDGIAYAQLLRRRQIRSPQANGLYAGETCLAALDL